jgi:CheY-like chemotaxis protein
MYKKLLLIDDDSDEQFFFSEALKEINASVKFLFAENAKEGVQLIRFLSPDLVFIDINMPAINGLECLELIMNNKDIQLPNIIIYSTSIDNDLCRTALKKGAVDCIKKQNSIHLLADALKNLLITGSPVLHLVSADKH